MSFKLESCSYMKITFDKLCHVLHKFGVSSDVVAVSWEQFARVTCRYVPERKDCLVTIIQNGVSDLHTTRYREFPVIHLF